MKKKETHKTYDVINSIISNPNFDLEMISKSDLYEACRDLIGRINFG